MTLGPPGLPELGGARSTGMIPPIGGTITTAPPIGTSLSTPIGGSPTPTTSSSSSSGLNEGLALFVTFAILFLLATQQATAKFALWVAIALVALVWNNAIRSGRAKAFWYALGS